MYVHDPAAIWGDKPAPVFSPYLDTPAKVKAECERLWREGGCRRSIHVTAWKPGPGNTELLATSGRRARAIVSYEVARNARIRAWVIRLQRTR